jgi:hypothetical protein
MENCKLGVMDTEPTDAHSLRQISFRERNYIRSIYKNLFEKKGEAKPRGTHPPFSRSKL